MSIFASAPNKGATLGDAAVALKNQLKTGQIVLDKNVATRMLSIESMDAAGLQSLVKEGANLRRTLAEEFKDALTLEGVDSKIPDHCIEAGMIALMGSANPDEYHANALNVNVSNEGADVVTISGDGKWGGNDFTLDSTLLSMEAFDPKDLYQVAAYSAAWNIGASRQDNYAETFYPTHVMNPDQTALDMKVARTLVFKGSRRDLTADVKDWQMKNVLEAYRDHTILDTQSTRVIPHVQAGGENADKFVASSLIAPKVEEVDGVEYSVAPFALGIKVDLLAAAQNPNVLDGAPSHNDQLDSQIYLDKLYVRVSDAAGTKVGAFAWNTRNMVQAAFTKTVMNDFMDMQLTLITDELAVTSTTKSVTQAALAPLADLQTAGYSVHLNVRVSGNINLQTSVADLFGAAVTVAYVTDAAGVRLDHKAGAVKTLLDDLKFELVGYDLLARRTNSNKRTRGLMVDRNYKVDRYPIPIGAPIAVQTPANETNDAQAMNDLINVTNARTTNMAVTAQLNYIERLKEFCAQNSEIVSGERQSLSLEGVGRWLISPYFKEIELDLLKEVNTLKSQERTADVSAIIVNTIRNAAYVMQRETNYLPVLQNYTQGAETTPNLLLGTDLILPQYIQIYGDPRTLGIGMEHQVVSSPDKRLENTIIGVFSRKGRSGPDVLSWGTHLWVSELVTVGQVSRTGYTVRELQVQPRNIHTHQLPAAFRITVKNLEEALTEAVAIKTTVV